MHILYLGIEDGYAVRRLTRESARRRIRFSVLRPEDIALETHHKQRLADVLVVRTRSPRWIPHALTLAALYHAAGKRVVDATLGTNLTIYSKLNDSMVLERHDIAVPRSLLAPGSASLFSPRAHHLDYPIVAKAIHGSGGDEVFLVANKKRLARLLHQYPAGSLMLQEYLPAAFDFRVLVLGYHALPLILKRTPRRGDFRTNAAFAKDVEAVPLSEFPAIQKIAEASAQALKREFTGIDVRIKSGSALDSSRATSRDFNRGTPYILEVNRQPEFETFEKNTGLNVAGAFLEYLMQ